MERNKMFTKLSILVILCFLILPLLLFSAAGFFSIHTFRVICYIASALLLLFAVLVTIGFLSIRKMLTRSDYKNSTPVSDEKFPVIHRIAFQLFIPLVLGISNVFSYNKDEIRRVYIKANNASVLSLKKKFAPNKILLILPHCLQNSKCRYRINDGLKECHQCSSCNIGEIKELVNRYGINAQIATGGTSARKLIREIKPEFVIAVACERDLSSGLVDVTGLPVYGILNQRPNGPCKDTLVDCDAVEQIILKVKKER